MTSCVRIARPLLHCHWDRGRRANASVCVGIPPPSLGEFSTRSAFDPADYSDHSCPVTKSLHALNPDTRRQGRLVHRQEPHPIRLSRVFRKPHASCGLPEGKASLLKRLPKLARAHIAANSRPYRHRHPGNNISAAQTLTAGSWRVSFQNKNESECRRLIQSGALQLVSRQAELAGYD